MLRLGEKRVWSTVTADLRWVTTGDHTAVPGSCPAYSASTWTCYRSLVMSSPINSSLILLSPTSFSRVRLSETLRRVKARSHSPRLYGKNYFMALRYFIENLIKRLTFPSLRYAQPLKNFAGSYLQRFFASSNAR